MQKQNESTFIDTEENKWVFREGIEDCVEIDVNYKQGLTHLPLQVKS